MTKALFLALLALSSIVVARVQAQVHPHGGLSFAFGVPQGSFGQNIHRPGIGLTGFGGLSIGRVPVIFGAEFGGLVYGLERRREPLSTTIPDVTVDVHTTNNIVTGHVFARVQPLGGRVRPYGEALAGLKYLYTGTSVISRSGPNAGEPVVSSTNFDDAVYSYGMGGGVDVRLGHIRSDEGRRITVFGTIGVRYLFGGEASYLKPGSVRREDGQVSYEVERSRTDLVMPHLGVSVRF